VFAPGDVVELGWMMQDSSDTATLALFYGAQLNSNTPSELLTGDYEPSGVINDIALNNPSVYETFFDAVRASIHAMPPPLSNPTDPVIASLVASALEGDAWDVVTLDMSGSTGADSYQFTQLDGPPVTITGTGPIRTVQLPPVKVADTLEFQGRAIATATGHDDTDTAEVDVSMHPFWQANPAGNVTLALRKVLKGGPSIEPPAHLTHMSLQSAKAQFPNSAAGQRQSVLLLDQEIANSVGRNRPFVHGPHSFSGHSFPSSFSSSSAGPNPSNGYGFSILNVKIGYPQWQAAGAGSWDQHVVNFVQSIPQGHKVYLLADHEPENDGSGLGLTDNQFATQYGHHWCAWQRRIAQVIADLNDPRCEYVVCHMAWTWDTSSGRNPAHWDVASNGGSMPQYVKDRTIIGPDGYQIITPSDGLNRTLAGQIGLVHNYFRARGFTRMAISEHGFNNRNGRPQEVIASYVTNHLAPYIRDNELVFFAHWESDYMGSSFDTSIKSPVVRQAYANIILEHRGE
jgi:hypothetical protein